MHRARAPMFVALASAIIIAAAGTAGASENAISSPPVIIATIPVGAQARSVAADIVNHRVYIGLAGASNDRNLAVVNGETREVLPVTGTNGAQPNGVTVNSVDHRVYATNKGSNDLSILNPATGIVQKVAVGNSPWGVGVNSMLNRAYVANFMSGDVAIVDSAAPAVIKTVGGMPQASYVAVDPVRNRVYVTSNQMGGYVMDGSGNMLLTMSTGADSRGVAVNPSTGRVYVANHDPGQPRLYITNMGADPTPVALPAPPHNVAFNPTTGRVFVAMVGPSGLQLAVLDGETGQNITTLSLGADDYSQGGQGIAVDPDLNQVYVSNYQAGTLAIIADGPPAPTTTATATATATRTRTATASATLQPATPTSTFSATATRTATRTTTPSATQTATRTATATSTPISPTITVSPTLPPAPTNTVTVVFTTTVGNAPKALTADSTRHRLYVSMFLDDQVRVYDSVSGAFIKALSTGGTQANGVAVNEQTGGIFVANRITGNVSAINPDSGAYQTVQSGYFPWGVAVDAVHNRVYVTHFGTNDSGYTVSLFDATTAQPVRTTLLGRNPVMVAANPATGRAYATTYSSDAGTYVLDSAGTVIDFLLTGSGSYGVAVNTATDRVYVSNRFDQSLHIVAPDGGHLVVPLPAPGYGVAVNPVTNHVFVITISGGQASLEVRDGSGGGLITSIPLGAEDGNEGGQGIAVDPALNRVYAVSYASGLLTVVADGIGSATPTPSMTPASTSTPAPSRTRTPTATMTRTASPTGTATFVATPPGGWASIVRLPIVVLDAGAVPSVTPAVTSTATITPTPTATATTGAIDWRIPSWLQVSAVAADVSSGQTYWQLIRADYQDETQSGGNHNIYYRLEDESGHSLMGLGVCLGFPWAPYQDCSHYTEVRSDSYPFGYATDYPIWGTGWNPIYGPGPYSAWVSGLPSDSVVGMGMPLNYHVNFLLTFRRALAP